MYKLFVGIDVSKDSFSASGIDANGNACFSLCANMDSIGFSQLMKAISSTCTHLPSVSVAMESTGCYHINLCSFLSSKGLNVVIINTGLSAISNLPFSSVPSIRTIYAFMNSGIAR